MTEFITTYGASHIHVPFCETIQSRSQFAAEELARVKAYACYDSEARKGNFLTVAEIAELHDCDDDEAFEYYSEARDASVFFEVEAI